MTSPVEAQIFAHDVRRGVLYRLPSGIDLVVSSERSSAAAPWQAAHVSFVDDSGGPARVARAEWQAARDLVDRAFGEHAAAFGGP